MLHTSRTPERRARLQPEDLGARLPPLHRSPTSLPPPAEQFADEQAWVETAEGRPHHKRRRPVLQASFRNDDGMGAGVAGGLATALRDSRRLLRVVHVLKREGKEHGWGHAWSIFNCTLRKGRGYNATTWVTTKKASIYHRGRRRCILKERGEGDMLTCCLSPSFEHHPSTGRESGKGRPELFFGPCKTRRRDTVGAQLSISLASLKGRQCPHIC